jgi:DNA-3-methyladenine glycosylase I
LQESGTSLTSLVWSFEPDVPSVRSTLDDVPPSTPESTAMSKELKRRGFRFVGPTTMYALMQAMGVVNDHVEGCWVRDVVESERRGRVAG